MTAGTDAPLRMPLPMGGTVAQARLILAEAFRGAGFETPELDARLLVCHALGVDHVALVAQADRSITETETSLLRDLATRRLAREPVARILGVWEFWGLPLQLDESTLVPRPDTETLVEAALEALDRRGDRNRRLRIADLGTGSGAILLALLSELPNAFGIGTDTSQAALVMARLNAHRLGLAERAAFVACDYGAALDGGFDLVVSNPPYIATGDLAALDAEVRCDPVRALDGGADGLDAYRAIASDAPRLIAATGLVALELGQGQQPAVATILRAEGVVAEAAKADLSGIPRAFVAALWE